MGSWQIAVVEHIKCGEHSGKRTLAWVPEAWNKEQFRGAVAVAQEAYLVQLRAFQALGGAPTDLAPYRVHAGFDAKAYPPEMTIGEAMADWASKEKRWLAWEAEREKGYQSFEFYLRQQGLDPLWAVDERQLGGERWMRLDWGHNHGLGIDFSATESEDVPGPLQPSEDW